MVFLRNEATGFLKPLQGSEGFVEAAFGGGHGALDESQQAVVAPVVQIFGLKGAGFEFAEAAHAPEVLSELVDQDFFGGVGGLVLVAKGGAEVIELGGIFVRQDELLGVETVLEGVLRGTQLSDGALGSGTVLGVSAIDFGTRVNGVTGKVYWLGGLGGGLIGRHVEEEPARKIAGAERRSALPRH